MALGAVCVGSGIALGVQVDPWYGALGAAGALAFAFGYVSFPSPRLGRDEAFRLRLTALRRRGQELLLFDNDQRRRAVDPWTDDVFRFLLESLGPQEATLFRDSGPNTLGLPDEVRWQQRLPGQVTRLEDLEAGRLPHALRDDWTP
jgi:hypothetical protein